MRATIQTFLCRDMLFFVCEQCNAAESQACGEPKSNLHTPARLVCILLWAFGTKTGFTCPDLIPGLDYLFTVPIEQEALLSQQSFVDIPTYCNILPNSSLGHLFPVQKAPENPPCFYFQSYICFFFKLWLYVFIYRCEKEMIKAWIILHQRNN